MPQMSRRRFLQLTAMTGGSLALGSLVGRGPLIDFGVRVAHADEPIKIGILIPYRAPTRPRLFTTFTEPTLRSIYSIKKAVSWGGRWPF
jgi:hypothetical protein